MYIAIKDECSKLGLNAKRVDENVGSGFIVKETKYRTSLISHAVTGKIDVRDWQPKKKWEA